MQAELYFHLKRLGLDVRGEVPAQYQGEQSFFDLVIFNGSYGAVIVEVKNCPAGALRFGKKTRQRQKYSKYDLPIVFYTTATPLKNVIDEIQGHLSRI